MCTPHDALMCCHVEVEGAVSVDTLSSNQLFALKVVRLARPVTILIRRRFQRTCAGEEPCLVLIRKGQVGLDQDDNPVDRAFECTRGDIERRTESEKNIVFVQEVLE